jgi:hypothetical protein
MRRKEIELLIESKHPVIARIRLKPNEYRECILTGVSLRIPTFSLHGPLMLAHVKRREFRVNARDVSNGSIFSCLARDIIKISSGGEKPGTIPKRQSRIVKHRDMNPPVQLEFANG